MATINSNFLKLKAGYLFPEIGRRVKAYTESAPDKAARIIRCGIGDVTEPLPSAVRVAMHAAVDEQGDRTTFKGYGPEQGYEFLRQAIVENQFADLGISADEIFISDGSKCDSGNILDIFGKGNTIAITDPVYPVYVDTNVMAGNTGEADENGAYAGLLYMPCTAENNFVADVPSEKADLIYLCFPNNPTGATATREQLTKWVEYAKANNAIILFDAAYEAFIQDADVPHSIFEIEGAKECAIEFRSFSKNGGFTGVRCAYTVIPKSLTGKADDGSDISIHQLWSRRHSTKFNGASYPRPKRRGPPSFLPKEKSRYPPSFPTTWKMRNSSVKPANPSDSASLAAKMHLTSGSAARKASAHGRCSTRCSKKLKSSSPPAPASAPQAKATSASPHSTPAKTWWKSASA